MTVIDRFEDNIAVLEADGEMVEIPREKLPAEAREGDILNFADGIYTIDEKATNERRSAVRSRLYRLMNKDND